MSVQLVCICWTCKKYWYSPYRFRFTDRIINDIQQRRVNSCYFKVLVDQLSDTFFGECVEFLVQYLRDFSRWLERHDAHQIQIIPDHRLDFIDIDDLEEEVI